MCSQALTALFSAAELGKMCGDWMLESHAFEGKHALHDLRLSLYCIVKVHLATAFQIGLR